MGNEFKDFEMETPSLTLEPDLGEFEKKEEVIPKKQLQKEEVPVLTPEEQKMVNDFATKIDIENTNQILQYGAGTQKKMADFSDTALENVKTQDLGEIGELISNVVGELKDFDVQEEGKFFGFFKKQTSKIENLKNKYDKAQANVEKITDSLQQHQVRLMKDSAMLDKMYEQNLNYFKELTMYILAGKKKLEETVLKINLEAAAEIARQLRLRNLSGIIMVDFIDMNQEAHKEALMDALRAAVAKDPVKTVVVEMTRLNLVEITRKKVRRPLYEQVAGIYNSTRE